MNSASLIGRIDEILFHLRGELLEACRKHAPMHSPHEGYDGHPSFPVLRKKYGEGWYV